MLDGENAPALARSFFFSPAMEAAQLLEAVRVLYHAPDDGSKRAASIWLEDWQASPGAWDLAAAVLRGDGGGGGADGVPVEARYLAAQTLRTKVSLCIWGVFVRVPGPACGRPRARHDDVRVRERGDAEKKKKKKKLDHQPPLNFPPHPSPNNTDPARL